MIKNKRTKTILGTGLILALIAVGSIVFFVHKSSETSKDVNPVETINYTEATDQEKKETAQNKEKVIADTEAQNNSQSNDRSAKTISPVISYIGQNGNNGDVQANGYIPEIIEKEGTCTLVLTRGTNTVTDSRTSIDNVQDTSCGLMVIPKSKLSNGTWTATLSYKSAKSSGTSEKVTVEVK